MPVHPQTPEQLVKRLRRLSVMMLNLGTDMDYYGGFGEIGQHGRELVGAGLIAHGWADGIEDDNKTA